jgi:hypothetical protein
MISSIRKFLFYKIITYRLKQNNEFIKIDYELDYKLNYENTLIQYKNSPLDYVLLPYLPTSHFFSLCTMNRIKI